ncbi:MAG TPA: DUF2304 domain-containing protein [Bryobacteraceae bacterium]|jgi:hypothetical protein|nr:DUF2304 domain-containing protein [Bryobacteraceae bacterium]
MDRLDHVMIAFSVLLMVWVLASLRRAHIRVEYSVSWLAAALVLFVIFEWPSGQRWLAQALGLEDAHLAVLTIAGAVFLAVLYRLSLILSRLKDLNIAVMQRVAILEFRLQAMEKTHNGQ